MRLSRVLAFATCLLSAAALPSCGGGGETVRVTIQLLLPSMPQLDPFQAGDRLAVVRVSATGAVAGDESVAELALDQNSTSFEAFPSRPDEDVNTLNVRVEGFDAAGNLIAFGGVSDVEIEGDLTLDVPFRRSLAYVTHDRVCGNQCAEGTACVDLGVGYECEPTVTGCQTACAETEACVEFRSQAICRPLYSGTSPGPNLIYVLDMITRNLVDRVALPEPDARARAIRPSGGSSLVVVYSVGARGFVGLLSTSDHSWTKTIPLAANGNPIVQTHAVLGQGQRYGVVAGGGFASVFDAEEGTIVATSPMGGAVRDIGIGAGGARAGVVTNRDLFLADVRRVEFGDWFAGTAIGSSGGFAVSDDGRLGYATSDENGDVFVVDMIRGNTSLSEGFKAPVSQAAYSENMVGVVAIQNADPSQRAIAWSAFGGQGYPVMAGVGTYPVASDIGSAPGGRRLVLVSAGTSTINSGLTMIDAEPDSVSPIDGSTVLYPTDPDDRYQIGTNPDGSPRYAYQRYRPRSVAVLYGR